MEHLKESVQNYSDDILIEEFILKQEDYTAEALSVLRNEIEKRGITQTQMDEYIVEAKAKMDFEKKPLDNNDFVGFEYQFSRTDILLATAVLKDSKITYYVDNPDSSDTIPLEPESIKRFTIHVHKDSIDQAHVLFDEHFIKEDGMYTFKLSGARDRLRSFNFHDLHLTELEAAESIEVSLTNEERRIIINYGKKLLEEADAIEEKQERVLFYYDAIEPLIDYLHNNEKIDLSRSDLLTILEILQVYSDDSDFPSTIDDAISTLLGFFMEV
jgi:hypothetical protein